MAGLGLTEFNRIVIRSYERRGLGGEELVSQGDESRKDGGQGK